MVKQCAFPNIIKSLRSLNFCQRCVLRYLGIKSYDSYASRHTVHEAMFLVQNGSKTDFDIHGDSKSGLCDNLTDLDEDGCPASKRCSPTPCPACLGILQDTCEKMVEKIEMAVKESGHHFKDFVLQLSLPVSVDLRQHLFVLYLEDKFGDIYGEGGDDIPSVKEVWKWVVGPSFGKCSKADFSPYSDFQVSIPITHSDTVVECLKLLDECPGAFPNRNKKKITQEGIYTRTAVLKAIESLAPKLRDLFTLPPATPEKPCVYGKIQCFHSPFYLGGRYNKYSRQLSQTPWVVDGERRMESSVSELIIDIVQKWVVGDKIVFSASGREDVDVKMLGSGRPFVLEVLNPRKVKWEAHEMKVIENEINFRTSDIAVRDFQVITKKDILLLKEGEEKKRKTYFVHCLVGKVLNEDDIRTLSSIKDLVLKQKTPVRVLHRRTLATRERLVHNIEAKILGEHELSMRIETQAGTYVKEFVHGDFGRTIPNLGVLLETRADVLELDVESIHLDWPPKMGS